MHDNSLQDLKRHVRVYYELKEVLNSPKTLVGIRSDLVDDQIADALGRAFFVAALRMACLEVARVYHYVVRGEIFRLLQLL